VIAISDPGLTIERPVSTSPSRFSLARGLAFVPSGIVKFHFQVPSALKGGGLVTAPALTPDLSGAVVVAASAASRG
jgi:hypothetical protein